MTKNRDIDDAELARISGARAGSGNVHVEATPEDSPGGGGGGGGAYPDGIEADADNGGDQELNPN